ncbi:16S rRNA (cytidine(1402)-2'-O)-methyltransferase [Melissococcus plutonius]|nr:16S rRNA (cytidine(1402)-2'-O)-methyltransferase [Melissococcus plutonius]BBP06913.1 16S rRNA (cytidine(1402)-2'-O)-methyltransferase [Melissococcus plutonius]
MKKKNDEERKRRTMQKQKSFENIEIGCLYLVPTPIGNLEDISVRCLNCLKEVDLIASEDTRNTQKLLNYFEIMKSQLSLHEHNYKERIPRLLERLRNGAKIAQVSDAGMPSISDPGHELVTACIDEGIPVVALPGPSAGITALIASGLLPQPFLFYGFLPRNKNEQKQIIEGLREQQATQIFYESPYRLKQTVQTFAQIYGHERQAVICRELTKLHEEYLRGTLEEISDYLSRCTIKGECCLLIAGKTKEEIQWNLDELPPIKEQVQLLIRDGKTSKEAIKEIAKQYGLKKQEVYKKYHLE